MRRGHPGSGRWRNENPRYFAPRGGGTPHFRPSRSFGILGSPRFPLLGPRPRMGPRPFNSHQGSMESHISVDRNHYRTGSHQNNQYKPHERSQQYGHRQMFHTPQHKRHGDTTGQNNLHKDIPNYYDEDMLSEQCHVNRLGDIDDRQSVIVPQTHESSNQRPFPWANCPPFFENYTPNKSFRRHDNSELNKTAVHDYAGHRPPSSDHYGGNPVSAIDNSNTFSRSVDDTVNIVKKRLLSRGSQHSESPPIEQKDAEILERDTDYSNVQQEPLMKRKINRQNVNINCEKIKNKIVHQLFMMDKDRIHKLMDNPNSSTKFEYAISSLITESQNSYNRHLRSVAEKSLSSSSTEFIHNDTNTIYEDTFMKQMQCILDPQDTVMLEDIKPMVLAELNKVLQLSDFDQMVDDHTTYSGNEQSYYGQQSTDTQSYEDYPDCDYDIPYDPNLSESDYKRSENPVFNNEEGRSRVNEEVKQFGVDLLFERRPVSKSVEEGSARRWSSESERRRSERRNIDNQSSKHKYTRSQTPIPFFDANVEHFSDDDDDPFAEFDKQYHVAVDHNFIETDDLSSPQQPVVNKTPESPINKREFANIDTPEIKSNITVLDKKSFMTPEKTYKIKEEIDNHLQDFVKSPLKFSLPVHNIKNEIDENLYQSCKEKIEHKVMRSNSDVSLNFTTPTKQVDSGESKSLDNIKATQEDQPCGPKIVEDITEKPDNSGNTIKTSSTSSHTRKRSVDQRPSHRKEKRKKSESSQSDTSKQILNKNIIIHVNDCMKSSEKCDAPKSVFNLFFAKNKETSKENKKSDSVDKGHSDKNTTRKETPKKMKDKEGDSKKHHDSSLSSHSIQSPPNSNGTSTSNQTSNKVGGKTKLKPIDMFVDLPKKSNVHQAHRNTATAPSGPNKTPIEVKCEALVAPIGRKVTRRHIGTQVVRKYRTKETQTPESENLSLSSRFVQTDKKKLVTRGSQTEPVAFKSDLQPNNKPADIFERMKEIDMEIQVLLQEKFKLYNSLESKESCPNTMQSLGMTVLNVTPFKDNKKETENTESDDIIEENPVEPLDFEDVKVENPPVEKGRRAKILRDRKSSETSITIITSKRNNKKKSNTPNISLIEEIISDDRPLEDIISLQDLEVPPVTSKRKQQKSKVQQKKKVAMKVKAVKPVFTKVYTDLIKDCRVVLKREDISKYLESESKEITTVVEVSDVVEQEASSVEETTVNDIQLDMLDVSEDIIIGNVCEVKCGEKDLDDSSNMSICEEIILDNSQSSMEDAAGTDAALCNVNECKIYDYSVDENLRRDSITVSGNGDAVLAMECVENNFLAACLDGNVYYFSGDGQLIITLRGSNLAVTCLTVVQDKYGTTVYTGSLDSRIRYYDLETAMEKGPECNVLSPIQTMDRAWDTIFVGTRTGFVLQFECKNNLLIPVSTVKFSEQSILALRALKEGPRKVLLVAARSESVTIKDAQSGLLLRTLEGPKMTVYTLLFEDGKVYCGTSGHQIQVFDYSSGSHVCAHEGGKGAVCLRAAGGLVFAGCYDGCVYVYREGEPRALAQFRGPTLMLLSLAIAGTKIIAGYKDRSLYIWKIPLGILQEMVL